MGQKKVPVKTPEGAWEIKTRVLGLAPRIRTALLLVDGVRSSIELERLMQAAGVTPGALQLLLDKGLIRIPEDDLQDGVPAPIVPTTTGKTVADEQPTLFLAPMTEQPAVPTLTSVFQPTKSPEGSQESSLEKPQEKPQKKSQESTFEKLQETSQESSIEKPQEKLPKQSTAELPRKSTLKSTKEFDWGAARDSSQSRHRRSPPIRWK